MRRNFREMFGGQKPVSLMMIGAEVLMQSPTVAAAVVSHKKMQTSLRVVGFGIVGLFAVHNYLKR